MIAELIVIGACLLGCAMCWAAVQKHKISSELQKHKITTDYKIIMPAPESPPARELNLIEESIQTSLRELLARRSTLEDNISQIREQACEYNRYASEGSGRNYDSYVQWRADSLKALQDAREEQQELALEEIKLLELLQNTNNENKNCTAKSVQFDPRRRVAEQMVDSGNLRDVELYDEITSRKSAT